MASDRAAIIPPRTNATSLSATNDIRAIKGPLEIHDPWLVAAWVAGIIFAIGIFALAIWFLLKRKHSRPIAVVPPHIRARDKLNVALALLNDPRAFCIAVSDAVRMYLEERFQLRAPERTTEEFLRDLQTTTHLNDEQKQSLAAFLERCDLVKFARMEPPEITLRELHESALRLVHETQFDPGASAAPEHSAENLTATK